jgi:hypothetical protein
MKTSTLKKQSRRQICSIIGVFILSLISQSSQGALYQETFDSGAGGWHYGYGSNYEIGSTFPETTGGNPGAHIHGDANNLYAIWIDSWGETDSLIPYGDLNGLMMTIDTKITGTTEGTAQFYVGRNGDHFISSGWDISQDTEWTTHTAVLDETVFSAWGSPSSTLSFILEDPDDIGIFFGGSTVSADPTAQILIDNFGSEIPPTTGVPEPSSALFLASATISLLFFRKKRECSII